MSHSSSTHDIRHENDKSSTAHQFSCCVHRLKRPRTSPHSSGPAPGTLGMASGADMLWMCEPWSGVVDEPFVLLLL